MPRQPIRKPTKVVTMQPPDDAPTVDLSEAADMLINLLNKYRRKDSRHSPGGSDEK